MSAHQEHNETAACEGERGEGWDRNVWAKQDQNSLHPRRTQRLRGWDIAKQANSHKAREDPVCQRPMQVRVQLPGR